MLRIRGQPDRIEYANHGTIWEQIEVTPEYFRDQPDDFHNEVGSVNVTDNDNDNDIGQAETVVNEDTADAGTDSTINADDEVSDGGSEPSVVAMTDETIYGASTGYLEEYWEEWSVSSEDGDNVDANTNYTYCNGNHVDMGTNSHENSSTAEPNHHGHNSAAYMNGDLEHSQSPTRNMSFFPERFNRPSDLSSSPSNMVNGNGSTAADHDAPTENQGGDFSRAPTPQGYVSWSPETRARINLLSSSSIDNQSVSIQRHSSGEYPPTPAAWLMSPLRVNNQTSVGENGIADFQQSSSSPHAPTSRGSISSPASNTQGYRSSIVPNSQAYMSLSPDARTLMAAIDLIAIRNSNNRVTNGGQNSIENRPATVSAYPMDSLSSLSQFSYPTTFNAPPNSPTSSEPVHRPMTVDDYLAQISHIMQVPAPGTFVPSPPAILSGLSAPIENGPEPVSARLNLSAPVSARSNPGAAGPTNHVDDENDSEDEPRPSRKRAASAPGDLRIRKKARKIE